MFVVVLMAYSLILLAITTYSIYYMNQDDNKSDSSNNCITK